MHVPTFCVCVRSLESVHTVFNFSDMDSVVLPECTDWHSVRVMCL